MSFRALLFLAVLPASAAENPRQEFARGLLDASRGDRDGADKRFEAALAADPTAFPLVSRVAGRRLADGNLASAATLYRTFAESNPQRLDAQLTYADFLRNQARGDAMAEKRAAETLENALKRFPGSPAVLERLFRSSEARGDRKRSLALFDGLVAQSPLDPPAMKLAATFSRTLFEANDPAAREKLDSLYLASCAAHPQSAALARDASDYFRRIGRADQAIAVLSAHVAAVPSDLDLRIRLGILHFSAGHDAEGETTLKAVLAADPTQPLAHEALAKFYRKQEKPELARPHAAEALKLRGGEPGEFLALADEWLAAGDPRSARILLEKAVFDRPNHAELAARLAIATRRDPETRAHASTFFRQAESLLPPGTPGDPVFLNESAAAMIDEGRLPAAEERLRSAIRAFPPEAKSETADALRRLASLWESQGKNADAAHALRQRADALAPVK